MDGGNTDQEAARARPGHSAAAQCRRIRCLDPTHVYNNLPLSSARNGAPKTNSPQQMLELCLYWREAISVPCSLPGISIAVFLRPPSCINDSPAALARPLTNIHAFEARLLSHTFVEGLQPPHVRQRRPLRRLNSRTNVFKSYCSHWVKWTRRRYQKMSVDG